MKRYENAILGDNEKPNFKIILFSTLEVVLIFATWIGIMLFAATHIIRPANISSTSQFFRESNFALYVLLFSFLAPMSILFLWRGFLLKLPISSLFNAFGKFRPFAFLLGIISAIIILCTLALVFDKEALEIVTSRFAQFGLGQYLILMAIYMLGFLVQTTFEELLFRGILVQNLCAMGLHIAIAMFASAFVFAIFHMGRDIPPEIFIASFLMGLAFSITTYRINGIEFAMGAHFANNVLVGAVFGALDNSKNGDATYLTGLLFFITFLGALELWLLLFPRAFSRPA